MALIQEGPRTARILLCGEAPGQTEALLGRPFVGAAGETLNLLLTRVGIQRTDCFITNVCHVRPPNNDFTWFYDDANDHLRAGLVQLQADIRAIRPNVVVALGAVPLEALTKRRGIDKYRGSILESVLVAGQKVIGTYHPSFVMRVWEASTVATFDMKRVVEEARTPEIVLPQRTHHLNPDPQTRAQLLKEMYGAEMLAVDVETFPSGELSCVGFSDRPDRSLTIAWDGDVAKQQIKALCESGVPKVLQNGMYDHIVLGRHGITLTNYAWETMFAHHALLMESASGEDERSRVEKKKKINVFKKGLDFQTSIYTREPYYKDDGEEALREKDWRKYWRYNGRDCCVTREIYEVQKREITSFGVQAAYDYSLSLIEPCLVASQRGVRIDLDRRADIRRAIEGELAECQAQLDAIAGEQVNVKSTKQVAKVLYEKFKLPIQKQRKTKTVTTDKEALRKLAEKHPHPVLLAVLGVRERRDLIERYMEAEVDRDGRMRTWYDITGTETGRLSSRESFDRTGCNLQNIPARRPIGEQIRSMFVADLGKVLISCDYSQAEARIVAYLARCRGLIELFEDPSRDVHRENAARIFNIALDQVTYNQRFLAKRAVHAANYGIAADKLVSSINEDAEITGVRITLMEGKRLLDLYFALYPEIKANFWQGVEYELRHSRTLHGFFGHKRVFHSRWNDELLRRAYAFKPQNAVGVLGGMAFAKCYREIELAHPEWGAELLLNVHDSVIMQAKAEYASQVVDAMRRVMDIPVPIVGEVCHIPVDAQVGWNWGKYSFEKNPYGLQNWKAKPSLCIM